MNDYPPEAVQAAANRLMGALGLHESARDTVTSALADTWDAGRDDALADTGDANPIILDLANLPPLSEIRLTRANGTWHLDAQAAGNRQAAILDYAGRLDTPVDISDPWQAAASGIWYETVTALTERPGLSVEVWNIHEVPAPDQAASAPVEAVDTDLFKNLGAALDRAADLQGNTDNPELAARIARWIARALAARNTGDTAEIRRLLKHGYAEPDGSADQAAPYGDHDGEQD